MTPAAQALVARIHSVRGHKVMLDADLAELYGVQTKALIQAVKRNPARFPSDFMFSLMEQEVENLRSQMVTSSSALRHGLRLGMQLVGPFDGDSALVGWARWTVEALGAGG